MHADALFEIEAGSELAPDGWVYVIGPAASSVVKIGTARSVKKRLASLQTGHPEVLVVRWYTVGNRTLERALHAHFSRLRKAGEWFDFASLDPIVEIRRAVEELTGDPGINPDSIKEAPDGPLEPVDPTDPHLNRLRPHPSDPDYGNPEYDRMVCGCRELTPSEVARTNPKYSGIGLLMAGVPDDGCPPCGGRH